MPLRGSVLIRRCVSPLSPIAVRAALMQLVSADSETIPYNKPAWVDPRLERPASNNEAASSNEAASNTETQVARRDSETIPYNQPAWVDPRLEQR